MIRLPKAKRKHRKGEIVHGQHELTPITLCGTPMTTTTRVNTAEKHVTCRACLHVYDSYRTMRCGGRTYADDHLFSWVISQREGISDHPASENKEQILAIRGQCHFCKMTYASNHSLHWLLMHMTIGVP